MIIIKSVAIKAKREFEIKEIEEPIKDGNRVIVKITKSGICGSDIHNWETGEPKGLVMGHEFCGIVVDPGSRNDLKEGDRVTALPISPCGSCSACKSGNPQYCSHTWENALGLSLTNPGAFTSYISVDPKLVIKAPDNITDEEIAMVEPTAVGLHAVHLADIKVGAKVLVIGGGIIGLVSALFAKKEGASIVAISETNEARGKNAIDLGLADEFLDAKSPDFIEKALNISNGGFDVVLECCGNSPAVTSAIMTCRPGGKVILVGVATDAITIPTVMAVLKEISLQGAIAYTEEEFIACMDLMSKKQIDVTNLVSETISLDKVQNAFLELTSGTSEKIKILIDPELDLN